MLDLTYEWCGTYKMFVNEKKQILHYIYSIDIHLYGEISCYTLNPRDVKNYIMACVWRV